MDKDLKKNMKAFKAARSTDKAIRWCAAYEQTKGFVCPPNMPMIVKIFGEMKLRLSLGSWKNVTHLKSWVVSRHCLSKERSL